MLHCRTLTLQALNWHIARQLRNKVTCYACIRRGPRSRCVEVNSGGRLAFVCIHLMVVSRSNCGSPFALMFWPSVKSWLFIACNKLIFGMLDLSLVIKLQLCLCVCPHAQRKKRRHRVDCVDLLTIQCDWRESRWIDRRHVDGSLDVSGERLSVS
jgi:hypothetical protein